MTSAPRRLLAVCSTAHFIRFFLPIWDEMARRGHETHIVCGEEVPSWMLDTRASPHRFYTVPLRRSAAPGVDLYCLAQMTRLLLRIGPHIVHGHGPKAGLLSMLAATAARVPGRLYTIHGLRHETLPMPTRRVLIALESLSVRLAHRALCVSESVRQKALTDWHLRSAQLSLMLHGSVAGVDARSRFRPLEHREEALALRRRLGVGSGEHLIGFVGRLARDKGIEELTQTWARLSRQRSDLHLVLVGERDETDPVSIEALLALPRVHLLGFQMETPPTYEALDLLVLPTYREGFPQVLLEAAAMEVPAIASRVTGCVDAIVDQETGLLVPPRDVSALASGIVGLLAEPERCKAMGRAARTRVLSEFQVEPHAEAIARLYEDILSGRSV